MDFSYPHCSRHPVPCSWRPSDGPLASHVKLVQKSNETLHWVDTFAFDDRGGLFLTSNKLDTWFFNTMLFDGSTGPNFRVVWYDVGTGPYITGDCPFLGV